MLATAAPLMAFTFRDSLMGQAKDAGEQVVASPAYRRWLRSSLATIEA
jgi:hypothetical protein